MPFIKSETAKFLNRAPQEGVDDEFSIALYAFHEAILEYSQKKGAFFNFASLSIRNRLIDYYRKEKRHQGLLSLHQPNKINEGSENEFIDSIKAETDNVEDYHIRSATKDEILEYSKQLSLYGLSLADIADNCPKQERTLAACHTALACAKKHTEILEILMSSKKLPITQLATVSGVSKKTLERHRKYVIAILLAFTNGFEIIRGHLCQIVPKKGD